MFLKDTYDNWNSSGHSAHLCVFLHDFLNATLLRATQAGSEWEISHTEKNPNYQQTSAFTHGRKTNVVFSFLSRHFAPLNTRLRVTFCLIWQLSVWRSICLPSTGSPASEVKNAEKWSDLHWGHAHKLTPTSWLIFFPPNQLLFYTYIHDVLHFELHLNLNTSWPCHSSFYKDL